MKTGPRLAGHPVHAALVHYPMGLCTASLVWDIVAAVTADAVFWRLSFWTLVLGLLGGLAAAGAGFLDFLALPDVPARGVAWRHLVVASSALTAFFVSLVLLRGPGAPTPLAAGIAIASAAIGSGLLAVGAWLGGELVYRHAVGAVGAARVPPSGRPRSAP